MSDKIEKEGMLSMGTLLSGGRYRIDQYLASGGFGNTYVATNIAFDEKVAIKELFIKGVCGRNTDSVEISISLNENKRAFKAQQEKFRKEAKRLRKLSNPHIVSVFDLFDENGTSYYVMDFIEGESLAKRLKRTKQPMSEENLMLMLPQILDALECVHEAGIWHLDLKPANIMVDSKGNVTLIDFGASKQLRNSNGDSLSTSSAMAYTPGYASTEQMDQKIENFGPWTDLYSLGATMYNLLTLEQPPTPSEIYEDSSQALKLPDDVSKKTRELISWLMEPSRLKRPQNVVEIKKFLSEPEPPVKQEDPVPPVEPKEPEPPVEEDSNEKDTVRITSHGEKEPAGSPKPEPQRPPVPKPNRHFGKIAFAVAFLVCFGGALWYINRPKPAPEPIPAQESNPELMVEAVKTKHVVDTLITVSSAPDEMKEYKYTGEIADTLGALPNGKGTAQFIQDGKVGKTYNGNFVDGLCEDTTGVATMTYPSGDKYVGTFKSGMFVEGKYTSVEYQGYYVGTFKNDDAYNGIWYNNDGTESSKVVNGTEQY